MARYSCSVVGFVYIVCSRRHGTLYIGVTNHLVRRIHEHKQGTGSTFTARHGVNRLVYFEIYETMTLAITREKTLKAWKRNWKIRLIEAANPHWSDLYDGLSG